MTPERELDLCAWGIVAAGVLAVPRRTRPLAGALYGLAISRAHGVSRRALSDSMKRTMEDLFSQKTSVGERLDEIEPRVNMIEPRVNALWGGAGSR